MPNKVMQNICLTYKSGESIAVHDSSGIKNKRILSAVDERDGLIHAYYNLRHGDIVTRYTRDANIGTICTQLSVAINNKLITYSPATITSEAVAQRIADSDKNMNLSAVRTIANQLQNHLIRDTAFRAYTIYTPLNYAVTRSPSHNCAFPEIYIVHTPNRTFKPNAIVSSLKFDESSKLCIDRTYTAGDTAPGVDDKIVLCEHTGSSLKHVYYCADEEHYNLVTKFIEKELLNGRFEFEKNDGFAVQRTYRIVGQTIA